MVLESGMVGVSGVHIRFLGVFLVGGSVCGFHDGLLEKMCTRDLYTCLCVFHNVTVIVFNNDSLSMNSYVHLRF